MRFVVRGRDRLDRQIRQLGRLVSCESPSADLSALARCAELLVEMGAEVWQRDVERVVVEGRTHLWWPPEREPFVLVLGHYDTVWPMGTLADWPFEVDTNGVARGPGVFDMKAGIVQLFAALELLDDTSGVAILLTCDEEIGSTTSKALIEDRARDARAVLVCEPSADGGEVKVGRKGIADYRIRINGRAAHAGLEPELGVNAGIELAHQILTVARLGDSATGTTVTPTVLTAGTTTNTVPATAYLDVDVRALSRAELDRVDSAMRVLVPRLADASITVEGGVNRYPMEPTTAAELLAIVQQAAADIGMRVPNGVTSGGGSDGNFTAALGVPTLDGLGAVGAHPHGRAEHVDTRAMPERAALLALLIDRLTARLET